MTQFSAEIIDGGGGGHAVGVPAEIAAGLSKPRARVLALVNGTEYHSRIARYGGKSYLGLRKDLLRSIRADTGDVVEVELTEEPEPESEPTPKPTEPAELTAALATDPSARAAFDALPPSHRQEYVRWISDGVKSATRSQRAQKTVARLSVGRAEQR
ncbi:MAG TPA: YdeI/OmpD-associated family protein [Microlunatus sp.]